jgi:putative transposase
MTLPRRILPNSTYMITRRCAGRMFRFVPRPKVKQILGYCLAVAAARHGVELHAYAFPSNHAHILASDPRGTICDFIRDFHSLVARAVNAHQGRWENLWSSDKTSLVRLDSRQDVISKAEYILTNVVAAGLVDTGTKWPGLRSTAADALRNKGRVFARPKRFFRDGDKASLPDTASIDVVVPPQFQDVEPRVFVDELQQRVRAREQQLREQLKADGRTFLGVRRVKAQRFDNRPKTRAPRRRRNPTVAARDKAQRIAQLAALTEFRQRYREARRAWLRGDRVVVFPAGTLLLARMPGVRVEATPGNPQPPPA